MTHHQYDAKYKESEIEWIGSIPEHWSVVPLFSVLHERQVKNNDNQVTNVLSLSYGKIVPRDVESNYGLLPESFTTYQIVEPGNIILRLTDLQNDKRSLRVGLVKELGIITSAYLCLESVKAIDPDYAYYLLHSYDIIKVFYNLGGGVRQSIKFEDIKRLPIICPPLEEQRSIVSFLDQQTAKLDELVEKKQRLIDLLQEKRQALITQAVTKGLDPNVPMKDSGTEWLGEVPAHWNIAKLRWLIALRSGDFIENTNVTSNGCIPVYGGNGIMGYTIMANCNSNTIVIGRVGAMCGNVHLVTTPSWITDNALYLTRYRGYNLNYLYYLFQSLNLNRFANKTAQPLITQSQILDQFVPLPSIEEQESVVSWLTENVKKFDFTIQLINKHISLISEYRQALITAAVTGQIDVREKMAVSADTIPAGKE